MHNMIVMDFAACNVHLYIVPANLDSEQIEEWISANTEHTLSDIHYMISPDGSEIEVTHH